MAGEGREIAEEPGKITGVTILNGAELLQIARGMYKDVREGVENAAG